MRHILPKVAEQALYVLYHSSIVISNKSCRNKREKEKILNTDKLVKKGSLKENDIMVRIFKKYGGRYFLKRGHHEAKILQDRRGV